MTEIEQSGARKGPACQMSVVEATLSRRDLIELHTAFADSTVTHAAIYRALKGRGFVVHEAGVRKHRRGECACSR